jgi:2-methylcitrate dehydratase
VAAALSDGEMGPRQLTDERISDPELIALSRKVNVHLDEQLNARYPEFTASRVEIRLREGRTLSRLVEVPKGDPRDPMEASHLAEKLKQFAPGRDTDRIERVIEMTTALEKVGDIRELTSLV